MAQQTATILAKTKDVMVRSQNIWYFFRGLLTTGHPLVEIARHRLMTGGISEGLEVKYAQRIADYLALTYVRTGDAINKRERFTNEMFCVDYFHIPRRIMLERKLSEGAQKVFMNVFGFTHEMHKKGDALALLENGNVTEPGFVKLLRETAHGGDDYPIVDLTCGGRRGEGY